MVTVIAPAFNRPVLETPDVAALLAPERIGPRDGAGKTCVVAMSGGVDSAVTALVMRERGYRVVGINLRLFSPDDPDHRANPCCGIPAMDDARMTCARIGIPFYAINMEGEFREAVVQRFVDEYAVGRTPNPCLECNRHVKFRHLVERAKMIGADCLATGHYARVVHGDASAGEPHRLLRALDPRKDQSYVLYTLTQEQLGFIHFPLGGLHKTETRAPARGFDLAVAEKAESQEICFVGNRSYADFVAERRPDVTLPGEIVDTTGEALGAHQGLVHHTVGQRRGLGIATGAPLFVIRLEPEQNRLVVGSRGEAAAREIALEGGSITSGHWPEAPFAAEAMVRYRGALTAAVVEPGAAGSASARVRFSGDGLIASPSQALVLYRGEEVLGGGTISRVETSSSREGEE